MTLLLALSSFFSRILGIVRNALLASFFGAGSISDAYFAAFQIPDLLYRLFIFGAISAAFVPLFLKLQREDPKKAWEFSATILNVGILIMLCFTVLVFFFSEPLVSLMYPDFSPDQHVITARLLRIMMLSPLFFTVSSVFSGIQNAFRTFWGFAIAPILYNLGILFGIVFLSQRYGIDGVAYGVVLGAFLHAFVQLLPSTKLGFFWSLKISLSAEFKKLLLVSIPRIFSMMGNQINYFIEGLIATGVAAGSLTVLRYAQDMQFFPIGVFGVSLAISSFSILSNHALDGNRQNLAHFLSDKIHHLLFVLIPTTVGLYLLRYPLVLLFLGGGSYDVAAIDLTATTLGALSLGIIPAALTPLLTRLYFSLHNTVWPFVVTILSVMLNTILAYIFAKTWGVFGIGLSSSLSSLFMFLLLFWKAKIQYFQHASLLKFFMIGGFTVAVMFMALSLQGILGIISFSFGRFVLFLEILALVGFGSLVYGISCYFFMKSEFWKFVRGITE